VVLPGHLLSTPLGRPTVTVKPGYDGPQGECRRPGAATLPLVWVVWVVWGVVSAHLPFGVYLMGIPLVVSVLIYMLE